MSDADCADKENTEKLNTTELPQKQTVLKYTKAFKLYI